MSELTKAVTDASFEQDVLQSDVPVLVDFWAPWCGPCKMIAPLLDDIAKEYEGKLIVAKVNVDDSPEIPAKLGVRGIPTLLLFKNGEQLGGSKVGACTKVQLVEWLQQEEI